MKYNFVTSVCDDWAYVAYKWFINIWISLWCDEMLVLHHLCSWDEVWVWWVFWAAPASRLTSQSPADSCGSHRCTRRAPVRQKRSVCPCIWWWRRALDGSSSAGVQMWPAVTRHSTQGTPSSHTRIIALCQNTSNICNMCHKQTSNYAFCHSGLSHILTNECMYTSCMTF